MYKVGEDAYESLPEYDRQPAEEWTLESDDPSMYMNHSCEPTCWFEWEHGGATLRAEEVGGEDRTMGQRAGAIVMTATRDLVPGDELTFDYATSEVSAIRSTSTTKRG